MTRSTSVKRILYYAFSIFLFLSPMLLSGQCAPDTEAPAARCKNLSVSWEVGFSGDSRTISPNELNNGSTDNCGIASITLDKPTFNFSCEIVGDNTVTLTVTDAAGNTASCISIVTVIDANAPRIACVDPAPVYTNSPTRNAFVTLPTPTFDDECGLAPEGIYPGIPTPLSNDYTNTPDASTNYPVGVTTVTWSVYDAAGNRTDCTVDVQVIEGQDPNVTLSSQAEVNDFVANYDGSPITGSLIISGADITDLRGLANITSIGGDLRIEANTILTNINGLRNITSIGGSLFILNNPALTDIDGLEDLNTLGGFRLFLLNNPLLTDIDGLQNLSSVSEFLRISIFNNAALTNIDGLQNIQSISSLFIQFNAALTNIDGLQNIQQQNGIFFVIENNDVLSEFCGVFGLVSAGSFGNVHGNAENPTLDEIGSGEACGRILPAPSAELPALTWPYLVLFGLLLSGVARLGIRYLD